MSSAFLTTVIGQVLIKDRLTGEVLLNKRNAVHNKNMAIALARGLANADNHQIFRIKLGNGGSAIDSMSMITYQPPNIIGSLATLYNTTYSEIVDEASTSVGAENSVTHQSTENPESIVICTATIAAGEPAGQDLTDSPPNANPEAQFAFDELGLFTNDDLLLTHVIFSPILKTANRELVITYTLTISVS